MHKIKEAEVVALGLKRENGQWYTVRITKKEAHRLFADDLVKDWLYHFKTRTLRLFLDIAA